MDNAKKTLCLNDGWKYAVSEGAGPTRSESWCNAQSLPTSVHLDLLANGVIPDPFRATNEQLVQWVGTKTWIYRKQFTISPCLLSSLTSKAILVLEGLDTYATVSLNGKIILETDNMFVSHRVDITAQVRSMQVAQQETYLLQITFHNAENKAAEEIEKHPEQSWFSFHFGQKRLAVRKAQYHFGWDWGPVLTDCGPWKPIYLELFETRLSDVSFRTHIDAAHQEAIVDVTIDIDGCADYAKVTIERSGLEIESRDVPLSGGRTTTSIRVRNPKLWWPWTLGDPNLYTAKVAVFKTMGGANEVLDSCQKCFGIRKIELVQQPLRGEDGASFFFRVNDVPIFAAGSCWVPPDSFVARVTAAKYRRWVQLAKDSNQVMIRVWGGGIYESDAFFDACDELGILVWHDFMFACGIYPAYSSFEESVMAEVRQNVVRTRHHPCIAAWCGNNEDYAIAYLAQIHAGKAQYDETEMEADKIRESGFPARLFYEILLPAICKELIPDIPYWPGSPFGGPFCNAPTHGDIHQWQIWHLDKFPYQEYPKRGGRMVTEFGLQSIPHWKTVKQYYPADDDVLSPDLPRDYTTDEYMVWHNKGKGGPENILKYGTDNIPFDAQSLRGYMYCSQLVQSEGLSTAFRGWRRLWKGPGREYCAGALVWQLNDCWPVSSWSIADSELRPKLSYWTVKRENQPITVSLARVVEGDSLGLEAWACNMTQRQISINYQVLAWHVKTGKNIWTHEVSADIVLHPNRSTELGKIQFDSSACREEHPSWNELVFSVNLFSASQSLDSHSAVAKSRIARHVNFHEPLKQVPFASNEEAISVKLSRGPSRSTIALSVSVPMKGVYLDVEDDDAVEWDDNGLDLVPGEVIEIGVAGLDDERKRSIRVYWLGETSWRSQTFKL